MNTSRLNSPSPTRFSVSRAHFSPLARRTAITSPADTRLASNQPPSKKLSRPFHLAADSRAFPNFWTFAGLDRLQPDVTRYHY
jgi:hypothetical protein